MSVSLALASRFSCVLTVWCGQVCRDPRWGRCYESYSEDHEDRAQPATTTELFGHVRENYFRLYFHYIYFNVVRYTYLQADNIFSFIILGPSLVAHKITLGALNQISNAFGRVTNSLQFLLNSWSTIVELQSVHKRLRAFEATLEGAPLPEIDRRYIERRQAGLPHEETAG